MFDSFRKVEGSEIESYIRDRSIYWRCVAQTSHNVLISEIARAYKRAESHLEYCESLADIKNYIDSELHPIQPIIGAGVVCRDLLVFLADKKPMLPLDAFNALAYIESTNLQRRIFAERSLGPSRAELKAQEDEKQRRDYQAYLVEQEAKKQGTILAVETGKMPNKPKKAFDLKAHNRYLAELQERKNRK